MSLDSWMDRDPKQFEYLHRIVGYSSLALILVVYHFTYPETTYQLYIPLFLIILLIFTPKLSQWLEYKYNSSRVKRNVFFLIDIAIVAVTLSAIHLNIVLTFLALISLLYTVINVKIPFVIIAISGLFGIVVFYLSNIFLFGFGPYFQQTSNELIILAFLCVIGFFGMGSIYQIRRVKMAVAKQEYYYSQMHRYMEFANQLSRYAPLQLWQ